MRHDQAHATGGGVQQDGFARLEVIDAAHQVGRGQAAHGHACGRFKRDGIGQMDQRRGGDQALGAVSAQGVDEAGVGDAVAHGHVAHLGADGFHHTCTFDAHAIGQRDRVGAVAKVGVGIVEANGHMAQPHLAGAGLADFGVFVLKDFGAAHAVECHGFGHCVVS